MRADARGPPRTAYVDRSIPSVDRAWRLTSPTAVSHCVTPIPPLANQPSGKFVRSGASSKYEYPPAISHDGCAAAIRGSSSMTRTRTRAAIAVSCHAFAIVFAFAASASAQNYHYGMNTRVLTPQMADKMAELGAGT